MPFLQKMKQQKLLSLTLLLFTLVLGIVIGTVMNTGSKGGPAEFGRCAGRYADSHSASGSDLERVHDAHQAGGTISGLHRIRLSAEAWQAQTGRR